MHGVFRIPVDLRRLQLVVVQIVNADVVLRQIIWLVSISGIKSLRTIETGTVQYGLKLIWTIFC